LRNIDADMTHIDVEHAMLDTIAGWRKRLLETLCEHVAIPTGQGHKPGLDRYRALVEAKLTKLGAEIDDVPGEARPAWVWPRVEGTWIPSTLVARSQHCTKPAGPRVLVVGHLDTVHDPNGAFRELTLSADGKMATGPGAADMKGGIVIALAALEALQQHDVHVQWTAALNSDEETGSFHSAKALRVLAREHDYGIVLEPALPGGGMAIERMGSGQFMIETHGRSAHVGREFKRGVSAVTKLGELIVELGSWSDPDNGLIVNVGPLQGAHVTNAVPDHAACWGNVRFATPEVGERIAQRLRGLATSDDQLPGVRVFFTPNRPAKPVNDSVQRLADLIGSAASELGQAIQQVSTGGVCDGNLLQEAGLPTIDTMGVRGGNLHRMDEYIEVDSLVERAQLLAVVLARLAAGSDQLAVP
jgi:glutamate carboxypeptidase